MIQYNNGAFNDVVFTHDFAFESTNYQLSIAGGTWTIYEAATFQTRASGYINIGANDLTNIRPYASGPAVPEPATWAMMFAGFSPSVRQPDAGDTCRSPTAEAPPARVTTGLMWGAGPRMLPRFIARVRHVI